MQKVAYLSPEKVLTILRELLAEAEACLMPYNMMRLLVEPTDDPADYIVVLKAKADDPDFDYADRLEAAFGEDAVDMCTLIACIRVCQLITVEVYRLRTDMPETGIMKTIEEDVLI